MLIWNKVEAGEYATEDGRFTAYRAYDRIYDEHWILRDGYEPDYYRGKYHESSLKECKGVAETILKQEREFGKKENIVL